MSAAGEAAQTRTGARRTADRAQRRAAFGVALVVHALLLPAIVALLSRGEFILVDDDPPHTDYRRWADARMTTETWYSLPALLRHRPEWAIPAATMVCGAIVYFWWRRSGAAFGRTLGVLIAVVATADLCLRLRHAWGGGLILWIFSAMLLAIAFLVAPASADRETLDAATLRRLVRRHGEEGRASE